MPHRDISELRAFNRFYTNHLGWLDRTILTGSLSLTEARVLFELHQHQPCTARDLLQILQLDKGYLSRTLDSFEGGNSSNASQVLPTVATCSSHFAPREVLSSKKSTKPPKIRSAHCSKASPRLPARVSCVIPKPSSNSFNITDMNRINLHDITIRQTIQPGDLGYVIYMHGTMYSREHHFGLAFETYVASGMAEFFKAYEPTRNRVWVCIHQDTIIGFLALVSRGDTAQLRYFLLAPAYRGISLGRKLMDQFMSALNELGYNSCYLLTTTH
jgi:GNAT superfamily N-acetyltransferase